MANTLKKELILEGLDCANCSAKIEHEANNIDGVNATMNFMTKTLTLETDNGYNHKNIVEQVSEIVHKHEPHVKVIEKTKEIIKDDHDHANSDVKESIIKIFISGALLILGIAIETTPLFELLIFLMAYVVVGGEVIVRAINNIKRGQVFDENFLMTIATIGAFFVGEYAEAVGVMLFYQVGELFQDVAVNRSRRSISDLMDIRPDYANLKVGNDTKVVSPEDVKIGDIIVIKPGEKVPLDGIVIEGNSMLDTSALTGESLPKELQAGDKALSGFININGVLSVKVSKTFGESTVSKILDLVQNASSKKAPTENFITKFARYYTPAVVFSALAIALLPPIIIDGATFSDWIYRALIFLVISCPCALVISIPLGFFGGIGGASKKGILVKGSNYLEALNYVETVVFDKTGTLTKGVFNVTEIVPENDYTKEELIEIAAYAEVYSNHPIANSIKKSYGKEINKALVESYEEIPGHGTKVVIGGKEILVGNRKLMNKEKIKFDEVESIGTIVHVSMENKYAGYIVISDEVKEDSVNAIKALKELGINRTIMLTGDTKAVGEKIGNILGLDEVYAELLPADKVDKLELIDSKKTPKGKLVYVGDGINDAPVLARADVGVAMGGLGSDAAIEAADIVIMTDEPSKIASAIKIARRTRTIVWQNIIFALGVKGIFLLMGALGIATMWEAVFADVGVAVIAILNSTRVMNVRGV